MPFFRQARALTRKNLLLILVRHPWTTPLRAFLLPVIFIAFLAYARNLFIPPSRYGIGNAEPLRSLQDALSISDSNRDTVAFVNNGLTGGSIQGIIDEVSEIVRASGKKTVEILDQETDLLTTCRSSIRGVSSCFGAAVFYASPNEGPGGMWNYSLRADGGLGSKINVRQSTNDAEIYVLPLQHEIDFAIARQNTTIDQAALPQQVYEYSFTSLSQDERDDQIRTRFMSGIIQVLGVAFFIGMVGVVYQLVGLIASERELGMTQIIEASMPNRKRWQPRIIRYLSYHWAFDIIFIPGWVVIALILGIGIFQKTSKAILIIFHLQAGLALTSFSILGGVLFQKAQLSGISVTITKLIIAVIAQVAARGSTGAVAVLSLLFPPMNYTYFIILVARWERQNVGVNLTKAAPENPSTLPAIAFFVFNIIQIIAFPILAYKVEGSLYGTASKGRKLMSKAGERDVAVRMSDYVKQYTPSWWARNIARRFGKTKETVVAVDQLNLDIAQGQIMVLLGANGSGKSTTLEAIAGLNTVTSGTIEVDGEGGIGLCPQSNVLWDRLTTLEHVKIFNRIKSTGSISSKEEMRDLIKDCDLDRKMNSQARYLSGGQKRKLQLSMMFTGGSKVCCVDECSSGVDALARQKLWSILLNERGKRTFIFTTHFLDEADLLSDQIAILSKGRLKAAGSAVELKHKLGGGYRIHVLKAPGEDLKLPVFEGVQRLESWDRITFTLPDSKQTADCVRQLEEKGIRNYDISSPTIEEIFFNVAEDLQDTINAAPNLQHLASNTSDSKGDAMALTESKSNRDGLGLQLQTGEPIGIFRQALVLFRKRYTVFQRNFLPYAAAFFIPIVAAGLVTLFLKDFELPGCAPTDQLLASNIDSLITQPKYEIPVGPTSKFAPDALGRIQASLPGGNSSGGSGESSSSLASFIKAIEGGLDAFNDNIGSRYKNVTPGGFFLGDATSPPTFAVKGNTGGGTEDISKAAITQNLMDTLITNITISSQYAAFDVPWAPGTGKTLQLIVYFGLAMCAAPAFFALYPTLERLRSVRQLHYSNGVKSVTLWSAYLAFDFVIAFATSVICIIIFRGVANEWYAPGYLFVVFFLYGLSSILLSYVISLLAKSQLSSFAFAAGGQAVMFLLYFIAYLSVITYLPQNKVSSALLTTHFTLGLITPSGNLIRAFFVALNVFATSCRDRNYLDRYPGNIELYGGPILYLLGQSIFLFLILLWWDSASLYARIRHRKTPPSTDPEDTSTLDPDVSAERARVANETTDGLRVQSISKAYGRNLAVDDISFGVKRGEVFALLGPNGAGKSTTISLIRGDILPSHSSGEIFVENTPISKRRGAARAHLGVCPQVDACDQMTVLEHLRFYARVRGVRDVEGNVSEVVRGTGLQPFVHRMAAALSGGNKRKLSLAIALMGNPSVLLLDEPSSGMDVCAKRVMWRTLASVLPGRSLLLTTHSMEEADALADRAGIMGRRMLAVGTSEGLRRKFGDKVFVHGIMKGAPHTSEEEMEKTKRWILQHLPGVELEDKTWHGQLRFSVPAHIGSRPSSSKDEKEDVDAIKGSEAGDTGGIGALFTMLEAHKQDLGFEYYSVSKTTLDQVFLAIVSKHKIEEENYGDGSEHHRKRGISAGFCGWPFGLAT